MNKTDAYYYILYLNMIGVGDRAEIRADGDNYDVVLREDKYDLRPNEVWRTVRGCKVVINQETGEIVRGKEQLDKVTKIQNRNNQIKESEKVLENSEKVGVNTYVKRSKEWTRKRDNAVLGVFSDNYSKGTSVASDPKYSALRSYTEHGEKHVRMVKEKSISAGHVINDVVARKVPGFGRVNDNTLAVAALLHDTGMDGDHTDFENGNSLRKAHPKSSLIDILLMREEMEKMGYDVDDIALVAFCHSKSCSGLKNISDEESWENTFMIIDKAVKEYNSLGNGEIRFDFSKYKKGKSWFNSKKMDEIRSEVAAIRLGDANRDAEKEPITQSGERIFVDKDKYKKIDFMIGEKGNAKTTLIDNAMREAKDASVWIKGKNGKKYEYGKKYEDGTFIDPDGYSKVVQCGEGNISKMNVGPKKNGKIKEVFEVSDGNIYPYSTQLAICERIGELNTLGKILSSAEIVFTGKYTEEQKKDIEESYKWFVNRSASGLFNEVDDDQKKYGRGTHIKLIFKED